MIVNDLDAATRLNSPMNLLNRLKSSDSKKSSAMSLFGIGKKPSVEAVSKQDSPKQELAISFNPFHPPQEQTTKLDEILENNDSQIKFGLAHDSALKLLNDSLELLSSKLDDVRADKLPSVIAAASKTVESIRKERNEAHKNNKDREVHYHFYTPEQKKVSDYQIIDVA